MRVQIKVKEVSQWLAPTGSGTFIITMPNVPRPLHGMPPRKIMGQTEWNKMRKRCYYNAGYKCEACGAEPERGGLDAHELYSIDWENDQIHIDHKVFFLVFGLHYGTVIKQKTRPDLPPGLERLFLLVPVQTQAFFTLVRRHLVSFMLLSVRHIINELFLHFRAESLGGLECGDIVCRDGDSCLLGDIACGFLGAVLDDKAAETTEIHGFSLDYGILYRLHGGLDNCLNCCSFNAGCLCNFAYDFCFCHN